MGVKRDRFFTAIATVMGFQVQIRHRRLSYEVQSAPVCTRRFTDN